MSDFLVFFEIGLRHVLDINAYDHVLFLIALTIPYSFSDWKRILLLVTFFTIGHTLSLLCAVLGLLSVQVELIEFLIPVTICITALFHLFTAGKNSRKDNITVVSFITIGFGLIHGLGFSNYFNGLLPGKPSEKIVPSLEFALGIEAAQVIVVLVALLISYIVQTFFRFSKRDWCLTGSAFVLGVVIPMLIATKFW